MWHSSGGTVWWEKATNLFTCDEWSWIIPTWNFSTKNTSLKTKTGQPPWPIRCLKWWFVSLFQTKIQGQQSNRQLFFVSKSIRRFGSRPFFRMRQPAPDIDEKVPRTIFQLMMKLGMSLLTGAVSVLVGAGVTLLCRGVGIEVEDSPKTVDSWGLENLRLT